MTTLINLSTREDKPVFVDAETVSAIEIYEGHQSGFRISNRKGSILDIEAARWNIDLQDALQKLEQAGFPLIPLPGRHGDRAYDTYVSPAAVVAVDLSQVSEKSGLVGANIHVEGAGYLETTGTKPADIDALLEAMKATGKTLLKFTPDQVKTNWYYAGALYIDPATVTRVTQNGSSLQVFFAAAPGVRAEFPQVKEEVPLQETLDISKNGDKRDLSVIFAEVSQRYAAQRQNGIESVVRAIVSGNPSLTSFPSSTQQIYVRLQDFAYASQYESDNGKFVLSLNPQRKPNDSYLDPVSIHYNTAEERSEGLKILKGPPAAKPQQRPAPKP